MRLKKKEKEEERSSCGPHEVYITICRPQVGAQEPKHLAQNWRRNCALEYPLNIQTLECEATERA